MLELVLELVLGLVLGLVFHSAGRSTLLSSSPHAVRSVLAEVVECVMEALAMARVSTPILTSTCGNMVGQFGLGSRLGSVEGQGWR